MRRIAILAASVLVLSACGPIEYLNTVTFKASRAVADAKAVEAEDLSPYEYWSAIEYLQMAKEKAAYADYQHAIIYGEKAERMALDAKRLANERARTLPTPKRGKHGDAEDEIPMDLDTSDSSSSTTSMKGSPQ